MQSLNVACGCHNLPKENIFAFRIFPLFENQLISEAIIQFPRKINHTWLLVFCVAVVQGDFSFKDIYLFTLKIKNLSLAYPG